MIYSPKKNIESFIQAKNEEIQTLKSKILSERVTYEEMDQAKIHLDALKQDQLRLSKEGFQELKDVLRGSHQAVTDLVQKKSSIMNELQGKRREVQDMQDVMEQLQSKGEKVQSVLKDSTQTKFKLEFRKERKNQQILDFEGEVSVLKNEIQMERDIDCELDQAGSELNEKKTKVQKTLNDVSTENLKLRESIRKELESIREMEHQLQKDEMKEQNMNLKIQNLEKSSQNCQQKIDIAQNFLQKYAEEKLIFLDETEIQNNIEQLMKMCSVNNEVKDQELKVCKGEIKDLQEKIHEGQMKKQKVDSDLQEKTVSLKELKEKSIQLKNILNSIFQEDSNVMKLISDKKVFPTQEKENIGISNARTASESNVKRDQLDMIQTSQNFFMTTSN